MAILKKDTFSISGTRLFQLRHLMVLFTVLILFQIIMTTTHKMSLQDLLDKTQDWYQKDSAEKLANLAATSLELLMETNYPVKISSPEQTRKTIQAFNIILSQQLLQNSVEDLCLIVPLGNELYAIDNGRDLYEFMNRNLKRGKGLSGRHRDALVKYMLLKDQLQKTEKILTIKEGKQTFHVFVPFVPKGEFLGALYMRNKPDFSFITYEMISSYEETAVIFVALILFGLLTMFFISTYTLRERDKAGQLLFEERAKNVAEKINHEKEALFTKRIYHTHHKAEKIMGFIKEDLRTLNENNIQDVKNKIVKYSNFVSRVIYDMKWYDPPLQTIRNPIFKTDLNGVIRFIIPNIFQRVTKELKSHQFVLDLDETLPPVPINEFVVWEVIEPLIQNSIEHSGVKDITITLATEYDENKKQGKIIISDNGVGVEENLLEIGEGGVKKIFQENTSTKSAHPNSGYGCYLAYEISRRCNWKLDAVNNPAGGCRFILSFFY